MKLLIITDDAISKFHLPRTLARWIRKVYCHWSRFAMLMLSENDVTLRYCNYRFDILCASDTVQYLPFVYDKRNKEMSELVTFIEDKFDVVVKPDLGGDS